mmetsp:Transcript_105234/g.328089  ORF Transcript_105234/g.328089 Transcript_105234/m.328089 type:complete len:415 (-) Transcript_105234:104-1348(-)
MQRGGAGAASSHMGLGEGPRPRRHRSLHGCTVEVLASCAPTPDFMKDPELFDFRRDPSEWRSKRFLVPCTMSCVWKDKRIKMAYPSCHGDEAMSVLALVEKEGGFSVDPGPSCRTPWLVVSGLRYAMAEGDVFRVGRFGFRVRKLVASDSEEPMNLAFEEASTVAACSSESAPCRICLQCGPDAEGQLIAPCDCKGSVEFVHVGCLQHWMRARTAASEGKRAYIFRLQTCELCKAPYPMRYTTADGQQLPLVQLETPAAPYVVLEELSMVRASDLEGAGQLPQTERPGLHLASLAEGSIRLGRCRESDVEIHDEYVSRRHAMIQFADGRFLLEDSGSKWGTLVALREELRLGLDHTVSVQVGPAVFTLALQQKRGSQSPRSQIASGCGQPLCWPPGLFDLRTRALWLSALSGSG